MPSVRLNDVTIYYEQRGSGPPLVLILGLAADVSEYGWLIDNLATHSDVTAFDNRGAGRSDMPDIPYSIGMMAEDAAGLMRALGIARANILAISMGGRIALELVLRHPERVDKLILVSTGPRVAKTWRRSLLTSIIPRIPLFKGKYPQPYRAFVKQRDASAAYDCTYRLGELRTPTLIMHGRRDAVAPYRHAKEMNAAIRGSKLLAFMGGHLFFMLEDRRQFLRSIQKFLVA